MVFPSFCTFIFCLTPASLIFSVASKIYSLLFIKASLANCSTATLDKAPESKSDLEFNTFCLVAFVTDFLISPCKYGLSVAGPE